MQAFRPQNQSLSHYTRFALPQAKMMLFQKASKAKGQTALPEGAGVR